MEEEVNRERKVKVSQTFGCQWMLADVKGAEMEDFVIFWIFRDNGGTLVLKRVAGSHDFGFTSRRGCRLADGKSWGFISYGGLILTVAS